jgi:CheY-like chemotaxis protein
LAIKGSLYVIVAKKFQELWVETLMKTGWFADDRRGCFFMAKILIVDDEPAIRFLITATLEDEGYELFEAVDGREAALLVKDVQPDLIILDVMMPGLTGYELCARLKQDPATQEIVIIMLTAKGQEQDRRYSEQAGADYYLRKPFSPMELNGLVASCLFKR